MNAPRTPLLILGLDGGTFDLIDPLARAGELPFLARMLSTGLSAPLTSVFPPKTIPAWYSLVTGEDPGALGIFGFTEPDGGPGRSRLVQTFRPHEALWDAISRRGHRVGIVNFPLRAAYPVNGFLVGGMFSEVPPTYPAELSGSLAELIGEKFIPELPPYRSADRAEWLSLATRSVGQRARLASRLSEKFDPELLFVLFRETDRVEHQHWAELSRPVEEIPEDLRTFWRAVDSACAAIDATFRARHPGATTLAVSDHGHGAAQTDFFTNRWLLEHGYLVFTNGGPRLRRRALSRLLLSLDRLPGVRRLLVPLIDRLQGGARAERFTQSLSGDASFEAMADRIDWNRTEAYSYPVPEAVYINPYNRSITPARRAEIVREIKAGLARFPDARVEVFEPRELYRDVVGAQAPVLLLRVNGLSAENRMDFSYPRTMLTHRPGFFYGSGVHRMDGILIASGPEVRAPGRRTAPLSLLDIAPTVLDAFGIPLPPAMSGRSFAELLGGPARPA